MKSAVCFEIKILPSNTTSGAKLPTKTAQNGPHLIVPPNFSIKVVFLERGEPNLGPYVV